MCDQNEGGEAGGVGTGDDIFFRGYADKETLQDTIPKMEGLKSSG